MLLTNRLQVIANQINEGEIVADIGTDHAYIPIYLVSHGVCHHALCSDIKTGPFEIARENVRRYQLEDKIDVRLGAGLLPYKPFEATTAVIAGMGGEIIAKILEEGATIARSTPKFVLQPMTAIDEMRQYLYQNGYNITEEHLAKEGNKFYVILTAIWEKTEVPPVEYLYIGKKLVENQDAYLPEYLSHLENTFKVAVDGMKQSKNKQENQNKYEYLLGKIYYLKKNL